MTYLKDSVYLYGDWYRDLYFWRKRSRAWEYRKYSDFPDGKGDLIFNTCYKIMLDLDKSSWAAESVAACSKLLKEGKRWPNRMNRDFDALTRIGWLVSKTLHKLHLSKHEKFRPQRSRSLDSYIAVYACAIETLSRTSSWVLINQTPIPWYLNTPVVWAWRRYLLTGYKEYKKLFYFFQRFTSKKRDYVKRLNDIMESVI